MIAAEFNEKDEVWISKVPQQKYYKIQQVSVILQTGSVQIRGYIKRGTLRAYRVNGVTSIKHEDLVDYIARRGGATDVTGEVIIEEIIPERKVSRAQQAAELVADESVLDEDDLAFLDAADEE